MERELVASGSLSIALLNNQDMAQKRMFSPEIVGSDSFIEMPITAQCLYFHLGMRADDDGFVNPQITMRMVGANTDDLKILIAKRFLLQFQNGVVVVKHWRINNFIRKDRYRPTNYLDEKNQLRVKENQAYTFDEHQGLPIALVPWKSDSEIRSTSGQPNVIPAVNAGKVRLGKVRLGEDRIDKTDSQEENSFDLFWNVYPKKVARTTAEKSWNRLNPSADLVEVILSDVKSKSTSPDWTKEKHRFCPHPATYINQKRWEDHVDMTSSKYDKYDQ